MIINYELNENNIIIGYTSFPIDESLPIIDVDEDKIHLNISKIINGVFYSNDDEYNKLINNENEIKKIKKELQEIQQWFLDNDWKVNKIITKEWSETDERWIEYLMERSVKRARQDFINEELSKL